MSCRYVGGVAPGRIVSMPLRMRERRSEEAPGDTAYTQHIRISGVYFLYIVCTMRNVCVLCVHSMPHVCVVKTLKWEAACGSGRDGALCRCFD